jgi:ATP-binding cassette, subfamily B, bacterial HlyB/CyaB
MADDVAQHAEPGTVDSGAACLVLLMQFHGLAVDARQLLHNFAVTALGTSEMLRTAKDMNLKAKVIATGWDNLATTPLPAIAERRDGGFFILAKINGDTALIHDPAQPRPQLVQRAALEAEWNGRLVLMSRRAGLGGVAKPFDVSWFIAAMHKYRRLLGEVLIASLFLQIFALLSPLFFQVVIDKVLVHRGMTTLDVLIVGLVAIGIFESLLTALRTYVFAHPPTALMSNSAQNCSATCWRCPSLISRRDGRVMCAERSLAAPPGQLGASCNQFSCLPAFLCDG